MEDIFEAIIALALVAFAIARKSRKNKAAKQKTEQGFSDSVPNKAAAMPAEKVKAPNEKGASGVKVNLDKAVKFLEDLEVEGLVSFEGGKPITEGLKNIIPASPVPGAAPAVPAVPVPPAPAATASMEGECDHPEHIPVMQTVKKVQRARIAEQRVPGNAPEEETANGFSGMNAQELRRAVVMSEVLDRPLALRPRIRRQWR